MAELRATSVSNLRHGPWGHYRLYPVLVVIFSTADNSGLICVGSSLSPLNDAKVDVIKQ